MSAAKRSLILGWLTVAVGVALAVVLRWSMLGIRSQDFAEFGRGAYASLKEGGFSALGQAALGLSAPFLYLLYLVLRAFPDLPSVIATKLPALAADFVAAGVIYRLVRLRWPDSPLPLFACLAFLFAPPLVLNSMLIAQADVFFVAGLIASLYFLMTAQPGLACVAFGVSLAFDLRAALLLPLLMALLLRGQVRWHHLLWIAGVLFVAWIPAGVAGRPLRDAIFLQGAQAPAAYAWLSETVLASNPFSLAATLLALVALGVYAVLVFRSQGPLTPPLLVKLALLSVLLVSLLLPRMNDRYLYAADAFAIVYGFFFPRRSYVAILLVLLSFFAYQPAVFGGSALPPGLVAASLLCITAVVAAGDRLHLDPYVRKNSTATDDGQTLR